jgi:hypothetical protein
MHNVAQKREEAAGREGWYLPKARVNQEAVLHQKHNALDDLSRDKHSNSIVIPKLSQ